MSDYDEDFDSEPSPSRSARSIGSKPSDTRPRASSQRSERPPPQPSGKRSVSSTGARRVIASSALVPLTKEADEATELRRSNLELRAELLDLNRKLDEQLNKNGGHAPRVRAAPRGPALLPSEKQALKNENQRKNNAELRDQLHRPHVQTQVSSASNALGHIGKQLEDAQSDMRGLENVNQHQRNQLARINKVEQEMTAARSEHTEKLRDLKERTRILKEAREADMVVYNKTMRAVERMEEKLKVQEEVGAAAKTVDLVKEQVEESDRMIDALKYQVAVLSRTNAGDKQKAQAVNQRLTRELHSLREEAERLRRQVKALGLATDLAVDVRV
jgi:chromosome segregation ATPase